MIKSCKKCLNRWFGEVSKGFARWHCRKPNEPLRFIGTDEELIKSKVCKDFVK